MKRKSLIFLLSSLIIIVIITAGGFRAQGTYKVHDITGKVTVERNGKKIELTKGMEVSANEQLTISEGAKLEILNTGNSRIYSSSKVGKRSVMNFIMTAGNTASDNMQNVHKHLSLTNSKSKRVLNSETGSVTRHIDSITVCHEYIDNVICCDSIDACPTDSEILTDTIIVDEPEYKNLIIHLK